MGEKIEVKILCSKLAVFLRKNLKYLFVRNNAKNGILRYVYLEGYYKLVSDEEFKGIIKAFIPSSLIKSNYMVEVFKLLETDLKFVPIEKLNADQNIINFENGILELDTGQLKPHSPDYLCTIRIPCNYMENVPVPKNQYFNRFMNDLTKKDKEAKEDIEAKKVKRFLLQFFGVILSNIPGYKMKQGLFMVREAEIQARVLLKIFLLLF